MTILIHNLYFYTEFDFRAVQRKQKSKDVSNKTSAFELPRTETSQSQSALEEKQDEQNKHTEALNSSQENNEIAVSQSTYNEPNICEEVEMNTESFEYDDERDDTSIIPVNQPSSSQKVDDTYSGSERATNVKIVFQFKCYFNLNFSLKFIIYFRQYSVIFQL